MKKTTKILLRGLLMLLGLRMLRDMRQVEE